MFEKMSGDPIGAPRAYKQVTLPFGAQPQSRLFGEQPHTTEPAQEHRRPTANQPRWRYPSAANSMITGRSMPMTPCKLETALILFACVVRKS
jgi:hypothetical protein